MRSLGLMIIAIYVVVALFAPVLAPYSETEVVGPEYDVWSEQFLLGTDNLGRDMLSRLVYGARNTVGIAFVTTLLAFVLGGVFGLIAATLGGWIDQILSRIVDALMAIPQLIFALLILTVVGTSVPSLIVVIAVLDSTRVYRLARAVAMNIVVMDFVEAAKLRGEGLWWIIKSEILPNALPPLVAEFGLRFCFVFLFISSLSFLGLGIQPPTADWGSMVRDNASLITFGDITPLLPAARDRDPDRSASISSSTGSSTKQAAFAMTSDDTPSAPRQVLLQIADLRIEGQADQGWQDIVKGVDLTLHRGEVLGLIGESGAGKSTIGLAAMGFARDGCRISGGSIVFDGIDLMKASEAEKRALRGARIAYVAQSAAAAFNPAHRLIEQYAEAPIQHGLKTRAECEAEAKDLYATTSSARSRSASGCAIRIRSRAGSCSGR